MQRTRVIVASMAAIIIGWLAPTTTVQADALYPAGDAGTWSWNEACDNASWAQAFSLWYIINDAQDYVFDIPDPDLIPGESVRVELTPVVVGSLPGSVSLTGSDVLSGLVPETNPNPGNTMWQGMLSEEAFTVAYEPGGVTTGSLPVPGQWVDQYTGFAALEAKITGDRGSQSTIVMLAQPFTACDIPEPTPSPTTEASPSPGVEPVPTVPPTDTGPYTDVSQSNVMAIGFLAAVLAMCLLALTRQRSPER